MPNTASTVTYTPFMLESIISSLNEIAGKDGTKNFQNQILTSGKFGFLCPLKNEIIYPKYNYYDPNPVAVVYLFEAAERLALVSEFISRGSPIVEAITKTNSVQADISKGRDLPGKVMDVVRFALSGLPPSTQKIDWRSKPKYYCGHHNFAHFFWNELSTADRSIFGPQEIDTYILKDPFSLRLRPPYSGKLTPVETPDAVRGWNASMVFLGASTCLSNAVRARFLHSIINEKKLRSGKIYITIRPDFIKRSLLNQEEFLCRLIQAFHEKFNDVKFVLDGFSMPEDVERPTYSDTMREQYSEIVKQSNLIISNIMRAATSPEKNIQNITGMKLSSALEIISSCSYYISHADTQRNKIGTLFPRRGFVHSNLGRITDSYLKWIAKQSDCSIVPTAIDSTNVENVETIWKSKGRGLDRRENYIIKDIDSAVSQVIEDYSQYL